MFCFHFTDRCPAPALNDGHPGSRGNPVFPVNASSGYFDAGADTSRFETG
jgi:hypothetical protein